MNDPGPSRADELTCGDEFAGRKNVSEARQAQAMAPIRIATPDASGL
ncbi:MAG TPA: hypothetical protein VEY93_04360 [Longimicrobium sp.]|nr:hypothetical protein [Longimicrobium sp.]